MNRGARILEILREHALFLALIAVYVGTGLALGVTHVTPRSVGDFSQSLLLQLSLLLGAGVVAVTLLRARLRVRAPDGARVGGRPGWSEAWRRERSGALGLSRFGGFLLVLVALPLFARAFIGWKAAIPSFNPFSWDPQLSAWDAALHGGTHPWQILQPLARPALDHPPVRRRLPDVASGSGRRGGLAGVEPRSGGAAAVPSGVRARLDTARHRARDAAFLCGALLLQAGNRAAGSLRPALRVSARRERPHAAGKSRGAGVALDQLPVRCGEREHLRHAEHARGPAGAVPAGVAAEACSSPASLPCTRSSFSWRPSTWAGIMRSTAT